MRRYMMASVVAGVLMFSTFATAAPTRAIATRWYVGSATHISGGSCSDPDFTVDGTADNRITNTATADSDQTAPQSSSVDVTLDYVFRELAISYLGRADLAHVSPDAIGHDSIGKGEAESKAPAGFVPSQVSRGLVRSKTDRLTVMAGGTPMAQPKTVGANALKSELEQGLGIAPQAQILGSVESNA